MFKVNMYLLQQVPHSLMTTAYGSCNVKVQRSWIFQIVALSFREDLQSWPDVFSSDLWDKLTDGSTGGGVAERWLINGVFIVRAGSMKSWTNPKTELDKELRLVVVRFEEVVVLSSAGVRLISGLSRLFICCLEGFSLAKTKHVIWWRWHILWRSLRTFRTTLKSMHDTSFRFGRTNWQLQAVDVFNPPSIGRPDYKSKDWQSS